MTPPEIAVQPPTPPAVGAWSTIRRDIMRQFALRARDRLLAQRAGMDCQRDDDLRRLPENCSADEAHNYILWAEAVMERCVECMVDTAAGEAPATL